MLDGDLNGGVMRSEQKLSHFRIGLAYLRVAINGENAVAKAQTGPGGWRIRESGANVRVDVGAFVHVLDRGPDSHVLRPLLGAEGRVVNRIEVGRVRVEHAQHPRDRKSTRLNSSHVSISYAV